MSLEPSENHLGRGVGPSWGHCGCILGNLEIILGGSWVILRPLASKTQSLTQVPLVLGDPWCEQLN